MFANPLASRGGRRSLTGYGLQYTWEGGVSLSNINIHDALQILTSIKGLTEYQALTELENLANLKPMQDVLNDIENMNREYYLKKHS